MPKPINMPELIDKKALCHIEHEENCIIMEERMKWLKKEVDEDGIHG